MGISIVARKYNFEVASPFKILDICNLLPVVKHSVPSCSEAKDLIENGKARLTEVVFGFFFLVRRFFYHFL